MGQSAAVSRLAGWLYGAPEGLPEIKDVEVLQPGIVRILGQNPGPATLQGTNTYLLGTGPERILVDASDGNGRWWPLLRQMLEEQGASVSQIVLTHRHYDHVGGVESVQEAFPKALLWKGPDVLEPQARSSGAQEPPPPPPPAELSGPLLAPGRRKSRLALKLRGHRGGRCWCGGELPIACRPLSEGQVLAVEGAALHALLTPGHSSDSACFAIELTGSSSAGPSAILTGDTVLGGVAGRFDDLPAYTSSLRHLVAQLEESPAALYPGHGAVVSADSASDYVHSLLDSLARRERAIRDVLRSNEGGYSVDEVCNALYGGGTAASMASGMVQQHLSVLVSKGLVRETPGWLLGPSTFESTTHPPERSQESEGGSWWS